MFGGEGCKETIYKTNKWFSLFLADLFHRRNLGPNHIAYLLNTLKFTLHSENNKCFLIWFFRNTHYRTERERDNR